MSSHPTIRFRCESVRRSGAADIRVLHAESAEAARARLIAAGLEPVAIDPIGPSLFAALGGKLADGFGRVRSGRRRPSAMFAPLSGPRARSAGTIAVLALAAAGVTLMAGAWAFALATMWQADRVARDEAAAIARHADHLAADRVRKIAAPVMTAPGITETLGRLAAILPGDARLVEVRRESPGMLRLELDSADPDMIRPILSRDPMFRSLREIGQVRTEHGTIRVTLAGAGR